MAPGHLEHGLAPSLFEFCPFCAGERGLCEPDWGPLSRMGYRGGILLRSGTPFCLTPPLWAVADAPRQEILTSSLEVYAGASRVFTVAHLPACVYPSVESSSSVVLPTFLAALACLPAAATG